MPFIKKITHHFEEFIACICLSLVAISVFTQVITRYIFEIGLHWTEPMASVSMVWLVYMGACLCIRERYHIRIVIVAQILPTAMGRFAIIVSDILWLLFSAFMFKISWEYLMVMWQFPEINSSLGYNEFYPQTILVIGYGLMIVRLLQTYILWYKDGAIGLPGMLEGEE